MNLKLKCNDFLMDVVGGVCLAYRQAASLGMGVNRRWGFANS